MSTWIYLRCLDHKPPLVADGESGQHLYDLNQIRADIAARDELVAASKLHMEPEGYFRKNTIQFLRDHPECHVGIRDEYGVEHPTVEPDGGDPS